jgi:hypothetical protein
MNPAAMAKLTRLFLVAYALTRAAPELPLSRPGWSAFTCTFAKNRLQEAIMKRIEWTRDTISAWPGSEYAQQKEKAGWRLSAIEWQRETETSTRSSSDTRIGEEIPYGTRIAGDCLHLEENPSEIEVLNRLAEMIVQDLSYARMADSLNQGGFHTRAGQPWTPLAVFKLTPRLIEVAPRILSGAEWEDRKRHLTRVAWNS